MSKIDELLAEHCPDGVIFRRIGDVTGKGANIRWADAGGQAFQYIDLSSVDRSTRRIGETATISADDAPSRAQQLVRTGDVIFATTRPTQMRWAIIPPEFDGQIVSTGYCVLRPKSDVVSTTFLAHLLGAEPFRKYLEENQVQGNYPAISDRAVREFRIPVPPLAIQCEIAAILDRLESLKTELEARLEAELEYRSLQYAFYRDALLTFGTETAVETVPMGDLGTIFGGLTGKSKADFSNGNARYVSYVNVFNNIAVDVDRDDYVRVDPGERQRSLQVGDVLFTGSSESAEDVAMSSVVTRVPDAPLYLNSFCIGFRPTDSGVLQPDFSKHLFRSGPMRAALARTASGVTRFNVSKARLAKVEVPIPPVDQQRQIASILDKLDSLVTDLSIGLQVEIAARRKQYEYYRDKLVTFKEAA